MTFSQFSPFTDIRRLKFKLSKVEQGHPRVMIYINFVELYCLMFHTKFQNHRPSGSGDEDFKSFLLFIAMAAILVYDLDLFYKLSFPIPKDATHEVWL